MEHLNRVEEGDVTVGDVKEVDGPALGQSHRVGQLLGDDETGYRRVVAVDDVGPVLGPAWDANPGATDQAALLVHRPGDLAAFVIRIAHWLLAILIDRSGISRPYHK